MSYFISRALHEKLMAARPAAPGEANVTIAVTTPGESTESMFALRAFVRNEIARAFSVPRNLME